MVHAPGSAAAMLVLVAAAAAPGAAGVAGSAGSIPYFSFYDFWLDPGYDFNFTQAHNFINLPTVNIMVKAETDFWASEWAAGREQEIMWNVEGTRGTRSSGDSGPSPVPHPAPPLCALVPVSHTFV